MTRHGGQLTLLDVRDLTVRFRDARRRRPGGLEPLVHAPPRRDARRRRRVRLGEERHEPRDHGAAQPGATPTSAARSSSRARTCSTLEAERAAQDPRPRHLDDLPGPVRLPAPDVPRRRPDRRGGAARTPTCLEDGGLGARGRAARARSGSRTRRVRARDYPAPVLGRHAPARDDRDGARPQPGRADRRRADDGARRDRAGADPRADRPGEEGVRHRRDPDHARPRRRRGDRDARDGDVRGPRDGVRRRARRSSRGAQHPYTWGLLESMPTIEQRLDDARPDRGLAAVAAATRRPAARSTRAASTASSRATSELPAARRDPGRPLDACHLPAERKREIWTNRDRRRARGRRERPRRSSPGAPRRPRRRSSRSST